MKGFRLFSLVLVLLPFANVWCDSVDSLRQDLDRIFSKEGFEQSIWGVHVESISRNEVIYTQNNRTLLIPASNQKLLVAAAILDALGPDFQFQTELLAGGPIENGVLKGPLIVRGGGDPSIGGRFHGGDRLSIFKQWSRALKEKGIRQIDGDIIGDDNLFDDIPYGKGWQWDDLPYWFAAEISALSFNDNCMDLIIQPGKSVNTPAVCITAPPTDYIEIINRTQTVSQRPKQRDEMKEMLYRRSNDGRTVIIEGPVLLNQERFQEYVTVPNPTLFTVTVLTDVLRKEGIDVTGKPMDVDELEKPLPAETLKSLFVHNSPPLSDLLTVLLQRSQNLYAEMFLKYLGRKKIGEGSTEAGARAVGAYLKRLGIPDKEYDIADGSGLSREDLVTPSALCALLKGIAQGKNAEIFRNCLPVAGESGTLRGRMGDGPTAGRVWAKTGKINGVRALSGYIESREKELFVFSFIVNNYQTAGKSAAYVQDEACKRIAAFSR